MLDSHGYYEFGLFKGFSLWFAEQVSRDHRGEDFYFYGFDSFEGLPRSQVDMDPICWREGNYAASLEFVMNQLRSYGGDLEKTRLYKGWFSKELFNGLRENDEFLPAAICVIDCDVYESCVEALGFVKEYPFTPLSPEWRRGWANGVSCDVTVMTGGRGPC
ncbi:MAG: hypothetical protein HY691_07910 [Chloroflexi bacterium]|nr:hypothetical protein [Chloroflexota bacterium]